MSNDSTPQKQIELFNDKPKQSLHLKPITLKAANDFVDSYHSHHPKTRGHKFSIGAVVDSEIVGVVIVGRPVSRILDDGYTAEITRCCTIGYPNSASMLLRGAWRAAKGMGYRRIVTYTLETELGTSLQAAGFVNVGKIKGKSWDTKSRRRTDKHPTMDKCRWEINCGDVK